jgi:hypothetical protein
MLELLKIVFNISGFWCGGLLIPLTLPNIHNYIDPGTGSLILQIAISSLVGAFFLLKVFWGKVTAFLSRLFSRSKKTNQ